MTAEGHLLFAVASAIVAKRSELTPILGAADWWHLIPATLITSLFPDIDHPKSLLGQRLRWIAVPIARIFGHRGFTHSLIAIVIGVILLSWQLNGTYWLPADVLQGMILGYLSHIVADMLTPAGVPLLWPCRWRFRLPILRPARNNQLERCFCIALIFGAIITPSELANQILRQGKSQLDNSWQVWVAPLLRVPN